MASTQAQLNAKKFISFVDIRLPNPYLGLYLDPASSDIPMGGWAIHDGVHLFQDRIMSYPGWRAWAPGGTPLSISEPANYIFDFVKVSQTRYLIIGDYKHLYLFNRVTNPLTADAPNTLTQLNVSAFTGGNVYDRWQSAVVNDVLVLTNPNDATGPHVFNDNATPLYQLGGASPDGDQPISSRYILNSVNRVIMANTTESDGAHPQRVRWSDINPPFVSEGSPAYNHLKPVWTPSLGVNEAGYYDINDDSGEIRGMASISANQFLVYTTKDTYLFTYIGLPAVWQVQTKVITDVGCLGSYSLASKENNHYFFGLEGFYQVTSTIVPNPIGIDRVDNTFFSTFQLNNPWFVYTFVHPLYPEIWFIFQGRNDSFFSGCLVYNWQNDVWSQRTKFPFSGVGDVMLSSARTMNNITTPGSTTLSWRDKAGEGSLVLISGDSTGALFIHDGTDVNGAGSPISRHLVSGDLTLGDWASFTRLSRVFYEISDVDLTTVQVSSTIASRRTTQIPFTVAGTQVLDADARHDIRLIDKIMQLSLASTGSFSLSNIIFKVSPAGQRV